MQAPQEEDPFWSFCLIANPLSRVSTQQKVATSLDYLPDTPKQKQILSVEWQNQLTVVSEMTVCKIFKEILDIIFLADLKL